MLSDPPFLTPDCDPEQLADTLLAQDWENEFCFAASFDPEFLRNLMRAGFLVMASHEELFGQDFLMPKLHRERALLDLADLHEPKSALRRVGRYTLWVNRDFEAILEGCVAQHGADWLTDALRAALIELFRRGGVGVRPFCFALYEGDRLVAGEFGVVAGGVYTSYSGYHEGNSTGTVQMILTGRWLRSAGYELWDLGMPLPYKEKLGARTVSRAEFLERFRAARKLCLYPCRAGMPSCTQ